MERSIFRATANPRLPAQTLVIRCTRRKLVRQNYLTLPFRFRRSMSRKPVAALLGNRSR
jgi:hypothetical protein